jgi:hypothetical protein
MYISLYYHRNPHLGKHKSRWSKQVSQSAEYLIFVNADNRDWTASQGHYWGVRDKGDTLGSDGERIAKFPRTTNSSDPWHGFPVSPADEPDHKPPDAIIFRWHEEGFINRALRQRMLKFQV